MIVLTDLLLIMNQTKLRLVQKINKKTVIWSERRKQQENCYLIWKEKSTGKRHIHLMNQTELRLVQKQQEKCHIFCSESNFVWLKKINKKTVASFVLKGSQMHFLGAELVVFAVLSAAFCGGKHKFENNFPSWIRPCKFENNFLS